MAKTKDKVSDAAGVVKPYVDRALHDEKLRENVVNAYVAAREIYDELLGNRGPVTVARRVATDKDLQENLRHAVDELRSAAGRVQGRPSHKGRNTALLLAGITIGILFNPLTGEDTRRWLKQAISGGEDEFGYSSGSSNGG